MTDEKKWERFEKAHSEAPTDDSDIFEDDAVAPGETLTETLSGEGEAAAEAVAPGSESETDDVGFNDEGPVASSATAAGDPAGKVAALEKQLGTKQALILRLSADLENTRSRAERDISKAHRFGAESLLKDLIPVLDSLVRGIEGDAPDEKTAKALHEGMALTLELLEKTLEKHGVEKISPEKGTTFDPEKHEAMSLQPEKGAESNTVLQVLQKGYALNGRVLRAAMVIVAQ